MFSVRSITSLDLPELQPYRTMRRQTEQRSEGIFVAEGEKVVRRLLESDFGVVSALMPEHWARELEPLLRARPENVGVYVAGKSLLETLTGFSMYQGLLAVGKVPPQPSLEEILARAERPWLLAAVDNLSSAENLGAVVRNCAAFNVHALITGETCTSPFLRRAIRSSMGTIFKLPVVELGDCRRGTLSTLQQTIRQLREHRVRCVAAHPHVEGRTLQQAELRGNCCLVFGSEGYGISAPVLELCDDSVAVPMPKGVDSLNVAAAAAVFLYEANRQRGNYGLGS